jgi:exopolysaccharide biosynthesis polyprenyl glycosylphosphotransferase
LLVPLPASKAGRQRHQTYVRSVQMSVLQATLAARDRPHHLARRRQQRYLVGGLLIVDALMVLASFAISYRVRFSLDLPIFDQGSMRPLFYMAVVGALLPGYLALFHIHGLYSRANLLGGTAEYARMFNAVTSGLVLIFFINFIQPEFVVARGWLLLAWGLMVVLCIGSRFAVRRLIYRLRRSGYFLDRTLIVGANPEGVAVAAQLCEARSSGAQLIGFVDDNLPAGHEPLPGLAVLGSLGAFDALVDQQAIDILVVASTAVARERLLAIYSALGALPDVEIRLASGLFELLTTGVRVHEEGRVPLVVLNKTRITGPHLLLKTALDYGLATLALLALLPLFALAALLIGLDSPGPVIYRRRVVGQGKREFDAFKLRTMRVGGDALLTPEQRAELDEHGKLKDDPRVTKVGAFLRRYSLDELPQLINVLRGEMSLIGPRMITRPELEKFGRWQHNLTTVKPGLTGLWQISGRSDLSYEERVRLDMHYIRNHSIWLDLQILFQTIPALISGRGAY